ncbi:unnamed protein product [Coffea canephora]|uniref:Uncharacterized protein n=1 Tax=Coffea canephora TaxID=49390 RepID=A0A068V1M5_COFCA|nr:unnamed protein product [Coffea canephora]
MTDIVVLPPSEGKATFIKIILQFLDIHDNGSNDQIHVHCLLLVFFLIDQVIKLGFVSLLSARTTLLCGVINHNIFHHFGCSHLHFIIFISVQTVWFCLKT